MGVISPGDLASARRNFVSDNPAQTLTKPPLNAGLQAIEDLFESNRVALNAAINAAVAPATLTAAQRRQLVREWAAIKFRLGG